MVPLEPEVLWSESSPGFLLSPKHGSLSGMPAKDSVQQNYQYLWVLPSWVNWPRFLLSLFFAHIFCSLYRFLFFAQVFYSLHRIFCSLHRFFVLCTEFLFFAQIFYSLHRFFVLCTGFLFFAQNFYSLHRFFVLCTGFLFFAQDFLFFAQVFCSLFQFFVLCNYSFCSQFIACIRRNGATVYQRVLSPHKAKSQNLSAWSWEFPAKDATYHALYPCSWTVYDIPEFKVLLICKQISPIFPNDYKV